MKFLFLNYELGFDANGQRMQGQTGLPYGTPCKWSNAHAAQAVELEVFSEAEWLAILRDLKGAWHMPLRRWIPLPVEVQWNPSVLKEHKAAGSFPNEQKDDLDGLKYFELCKKAREEGLDPGNRPKSVPIKDFIRKHRKQTAGV